MSEVQTLRLVVNRRALARACARAAEHGVARGGRYDVRGSALVIWPEPWSALPRPAPPASGYPAPGTRPRGEPIGMISWEWSLPDEPFATVTRVEAAEGHSPEEVLAHLHRLLNPRGPVAPGDE
ncbi:MAG TPA: hypothetical protein VGM69_16410 [Chloroflexota bacterium]|jgi:hypothetical protein